MTRKHTILDHSIIGYFVLVIFVMFFSSIGASLIDKPLSNVIPGYAREMSGLGTTVTSVSGIGAAIGVLISVIIFTLWFRPDFKGILGVRGFLWGIVVMLPFLIADYVGAVIDLHTFGFGNVLVAFLSALSPGFTEEVAFRGLGIANYMRTIKSEKQIKQIFWLSTLLFAGIHITNIFSAGNPLAGIFQIIYCIGLVNAYYSSTGGLSTQLVASDWVNLVASAIGIVTALILLSPKHYPQIMELWKEKWSR